MMYIILIERPIMSDDIRSQRKQASHDRILDAASRALRRGGYAGVGVADVMKEAGLTHGGFYAHFASRDALLAGALNHAGQESSGALAQRVAARVAEGSSPFRALIELYLSDRHIAAVETGCPVAALGSEMPRQSAELRAASRERVRSLLTLVGSVLPRDAAPGSEFAVTSMMVGALQMARALGDNAEGKAVLAASREALLRQYDTGASR
jgi:TetR/AcrR family transcriptional regulator, transcriptional repressor for nem operon